jgi:hypothetical protein
MARLGTGGRGREVVLTGVDLGIRGGRAARPPDARLEEQALSRPVVVITIDTEEDNWGSYTFEGATVRNIGELSRVQEIFDRHGAKPTYLVNYAPLVDADSVRILGELAARADVEIGAHCHPWNTPPQTPGGVENSWMYRLPEEVNRAKIEAVRDRCVSELGVRPTSFRAGRWGMGPTVTRALHAAGFTVDCSVSPFVDWSRQGGPDYFEAPHLPYRFDPDRPLVPDPCGPMLQMPTTVGFMRGDPPRAARLRRRLESSPLARLRVVGLLDRSGLLTRRWLSPETGSGGDMVKLVDSCLRRSEDAFVQLTFHSCTLLPDATPFVADAGERDRFLASIDQVLDHMVSVGAVFERLSETAVRV